MRYLAVIFSCRFSESGWHSWYTFVTCPCRVRLALDDGSRMTLNVTVFVNVYAEGKLRTCLIETCLRIAYRRSNMHVLIVHLSSPLDRSESICIVFPGRSSHSNDN